MSDQEFEDSEKDIIINWFQSLSNDAKYRIIYSQYYLHLSLKDNNALRLEKIHQKEILNKEKIINKLQYDYNQVSSEYEVLNKTMGFQKMSEQFATLNNSISVLENKLTTNYVKGKIGENWIEDQLSVIPNLLVKNITRLKGSTDFYAEISHKGFLIESKNVEVVNNGQLENFHKDLLNTNLDISFAIFVAQRARLVNGKAFSLELINNIYVFYISDVFNYPDRLLTAIHLGITLSKTSENHQLNFNKITTILEKIDKLSIFLKDIQHNIGQQEKIVKSGILEIEDLLKIITNEPSKPSNETKVETKVSNNECEPSNNECEPSNNECEPSNNETINECEPSVVEEPVETIQTRILNLSKNYIKNNQKFSSGDLQNEINLYLGDKDLLSTVKFNKIIKDMGGLKSIKQRASEELSKVSDNESNNSNSKINDLLEQSSQLLASFKT